MATADRSNHPPAKPGLVAVRIPEETQNPQARGRARGAHALKVHVISLDIFTIMIYAGSVSPERGGQDAQADCPLPYNVYETRALTNISGKITER